MGGGFVDEIGTLICWLFNKLRGKEVSLKEEFRDTLATRHLVVGYLFSFMLTILLVWIFSCQ